MFNPTFLLVSVLAYVKLLRVPFLLLYHSSKVLAKVVAINFAHFVYLVHSSTFQNFRPKISDVIFCSVLDLLLLTIENIFFFLKKYAPCEAIFKIHELTLTSACTKKIYFWCTDHCLQFTFDIRIHRIRHFFLRSSISLQQNVSIEF